jgi:hypothetical protein
MTLSARIGIDVDTGAQVRDRLEAIIATGAGMVRVRFPLAERPAPDEPYLDAAREVVRDLRRKGLNVLAVVDGSLTVAPEGLGAFAEHPPAGLAEAWQQELIANATVLAGAVGDLVGAWEVLPEPNAGHPPRIAPVRWATLLSNVVPSLRATAPGATIVTGGLVSDDTDDGVDYLRQVFRDAQAADLWAAEAPPFDMLGLQLHILPDGGPSEDAVAAALGERTRRLWRVLEQIEGTAVARRHGVFVTGVGWDAARAGEEVQARNVWTALNTLTADPIVRGVVWTGLTDSATVASGLHRGQDLTPEARRPAWQAFSDFAVYARQISPSPTFEALAQLQALTEPEAAPLVPPGAEAPAEVPVAAEAPPTVASEPEVPLGVGPATAAAIAALAAAVEHVAPAPVPAESEPPTDVPSEVEPPPVAPVVAEAPAVETIVFRIPTAADVLQALGLADDQLAAALAAVTATYGDPASLPPGEYLVTLGAVPAAEAPAGFTNQELLVALYRAGGQSWQLVERSGLRFSQLTSHRDEPYAGVPIESLAGLTEAERSLVAQLLAEPAGT